MFLSVFLVFNLSKFIIEFGVLTPNSLEGIRN